MAVHDTGGRLCVLGTILAFCFPLGAVAATPTTKTRIVHHSVVHHPAPHPVVNTTHVGWHPAPRRAQVERRIAYHHVAVWHQPVRHAFVSHYYYGNVLQCVTYVNRESDVHLPGNAVDWWRNAAGIYDRGQRPQVGSVLSFRGIGRMPLGHVAVVSRVVNSRLIEINQAHWPVAGEVGGVSLHVPVVDVSPDNDWTAVRVGLATDGSSFGSTYPTNGFIYPRGLAPQMVTASAGQAGAAGRSTGAALTPAYGPATYSEVAEAPADARGIDLRISDAPARDLR